VRPRSIIWFERVVLVAFGLGIINIYFEWSALMARARSPYPMVSLSTGLLVYFGPYALLVWLISRKGNAAARGIFAILVLLVDFLFLAVLPPASQMSAATVLGIAQALLTLASLALIFGRDTVLWFKGRRREVDPEIFR
jgi:FtsH-binding integral membrane protein